MKSRLYVWIIFFLTLFPGNSYAEDTIRIASGEWPPFYSENLEYYGLDSRIVTESFALEGIRVIYRFFPWKRSYEYSKAGEWDGTIGWPHSKEREKFHYYSKHPINEGEMGIFLS